MVVYEHKTEEHEGKQKQILSRPTHNLYTPIDISETFFEHTTYGDSNSVNYNMIYFQRARTNIKGCVIRVAISLIRFATIRVNPNKQKCCFNGQPQVQLPRGLQIIVNIDKI